MREGILWGESKPCEFWAVEDLIGKTEGLKIIGGIGKTCSVILTRRSRSTPEDKDGEGKNISEEANIEAPEEDPGEETEFSMVDSKEKEGIEKWAKQHQHLFGTAGGRTQPEEPKTEKVVPRGPLTIHQIGDETDSTDEDFTASSDDDASGDGSDSDESGGEGEGEEEDDEDGEGEEDAAESAASSEGESEEELDPKHHPLLRAGALPRMSKAVMDMAVGMVMDEVMEGDSDEEEVDELME